MKVAVIGREITDMPKGIVAALKDFEIEAFLVPLTEFYRGCSYWQRKLYKLGYKNLEIEYNNALIKSIKDKCDEINPDFILVLDGVEATIPMLEALSEHKLVLYMWDVLAEFPEFAERCRHYEYIFAFEEKDTAIIKNRYRYTNCSYLPVGYDKHIYYPQKIPYKYDISFIGIPKDNRLEILDKVAVIANERNLSMKIGGPWYDKNHFWKKQQFQSKHPYLAPYIDNKNFSSEECADIYRKSKICLNINAGGRSSLNPRTFDILATKSFQIMNAGYNAHGVIDLDKSLVQYEDIEDLIAKILYYLENDDERQKFSCYGYKQAQKLSMTAIMEKMLGFLQHKRII